LLSALLARSKISLPVGSFSLSETNTVVEK
jgi:hypothetical protein